MYGDNYLEKWVYSRVCMVITTQRSAGDCRQEGAVQVKSRSSNMYGRLLKIKIKISNKEAERRWHGA